MDDYISREAALEAFSQDCYGCCGKGIFCGACRTGENEKKIRAVPPADVIPRATLEAGIEEAIALLNFINGEGRLDYSAYSELHDAITDILPGKEADNG